MHSSCVNLFVALLLERLDRLVDVCDSADICIPRGRTQRFLHSNGTFPDLPHFHLRFHMLPSRPLPASPHTYLECTSNLGRWF